MEVHAITRSVRISPTKARQVMRTIQGKPANQAVEMLNLIPRKAARLIVKTLKSAIANAENNNELAAENLFVRSAVVESGIHFRRFVPAPRGMAHPIKKRTSHLKIILSDEAPVSKK